MTLGQRDQLNDEHDAGYSQDEQEQHDGEGGGGSHRSVDDTATHQRFRQHAMTRTVRFITRERCTLCAEALPGVADRTRRQGWEIEIVDVDQAGLDFDFGDRVPVVLLDGVEVLSGRFGDRDVKRALR